MPTSTVWVRVGEDARLQCPLLEVSDTTAASLEAPAAAPTMVSWYRKLAGQGPELLLSLRSLNGSHVKYGDGVRPEKVWAAADGSLLLRGSEQSDSAVYYCGVSRGFDGRIGPDPET